MTPAYLHIDARPSLPSRARAMSIMARTRARHRADLEPAVAAARHPLERPDILINARAVPLHAGIAFGAMIAGVLWLWVNRDPAKCFWR